MNKYLLFSYMCYYPTGGMDDCIFVTESFEELNNYILEYVKKQGYTDDFVEYYDCKNGELYTADIVMLKKGIVRWILRD